MHLGADQTEEVLDVKHLKEARTEESQSKHEDKRYYRDALPTKNIEYLG